MLRFLDAANAITLLGLCAAIGCALAAVEQRFALAIVAFMGAGLCDLCDGLVARRAHRDPQQSEFGGHLDSVVDACSFAFAPVVLLYCLGLNSWWETGLLLLLAACAVWRLAYFDTIGIHVNGNQRHYEGLPTTYLALILPLVCLLGFWDSGALHGGLVCVTPLLALAMISRVRFRKPDRYWYAVFLVAWIGATCGYLYFGDRFLIE